MAHVGNRPVTVVTRHPGVLTCMNCGSRQYEITRHRRKCWQCGSTRYKRKGARLEVSRVEVKQDAGNFWPITSNTIEPGKPFGSLEPDFKLEVVS